MMTRFGRPSRVKDVIGVVMVTAAVALLWVESTLAAGGTAVAAPDSADVVVVDDVMTMTTTAPVGVDCT